MFRVVGTFLDFVRRSGTTRAEGPHGGALHVRGAKRNRVGHSRAHRCIYRAFAGRLKDAQPCTCPQPFNSTPMGGASDFI